MGPASIFISPTRSSLYISIKSINRNWEFSYFVNTAPHKSLKINSASFLAASKSYSSAILENMMEDFLTEFVVSSSFSLYLYALTLFISFLMFFKADAKGASLWTCVGWVGGVGTIGSITSLSFSTILTFVLYNID